VSKKKPWYDDDAFWKAVEPVLFTQARIEDTPAEIDKVLSLLGLPEGAHILDLCCGIGRHSIEFARRGFKVTGVDRTRSYLVKARRQAKKEELKDVTFIEGDMRTYCSPNTYDAVLNLYTSFSYFEDPEEDKRVLVNVHESLRDGGVFILQMMGKEVIARIFQARRWHEEDGMLILEESAICDNWGWIENRWIIIKDGRRKVLNLAHRLYSAKELTVIMADIGFGSIDAYGDLDGSPYDNKAKIMLIVARK
jgi:SAM-dependent methyltransferase